MIARLDNLRQHPAVFRHLTGITVEVFDALAEVVVPAVEAAHRKGLERPDRQRAIGGGDDFDLPLIDRLLAAVVWLRRYPAQGVLGFLFGVSDSTAKRAVGRCLCVPSSSDRRGARDRAVEAVRGGESREPAPTAGHAVRVRAIAGLVNRCSTTERTPENRRGRGWTRYRLIVNEV